MYREYAKSATEEKKIKKKKKSRYNPTCIPLILNPGPHPNSHIMVPCTWALSILTVSIG